MKKCIILLLSVLLLCSGCGTASLDRLSEAESVLIDWGSAPLMRINGSEIVEQFYDNLKSLTLEEVKNAEPMPVLYALEFYNESDEALLNLTIHHDGRLSFGGKSYAITDGELDTRWIDTFITKSSGPPSG